MVDRAGRDPEKNDQAGDFSLWENQYLQGQDRRLPVSIDDQHILDQKLS